VCRLEVKGGLNSKFYYSQACCWIQILIIMRKYRVLQLGLQLGYLVAMDICNSWYLYNLECYRTSCNNCSRHLMSYTISYIWCNWHATICNFFTTNLHVKFPHTFQHGKQNANVTFYPFVDKWHMLIPFATYLQLFYN